MEPDAGTVEGLCERALNGDGLSRDEIVDLLALRDARNLDILRRAAEEALQRWVGDGVEIVFRISISNYCVHDCVCCDWRADNDQVERYRLDEDELLRQVSSISSDSSAVIIIDGAEDPELDAGYVGSIAGRLLEDTAVSKVIPSLGERPTDYYERLKDCGLDDYMLDHRTSSPILYGELHPDSDYFRRMKCIEDLKSLGFSVGTFIMAGLPRQDIWDMADDILLVREMGFGLVVAAPFVPGPFCQSPFSSRTSVQTALNLVAVSRLLLRDIKLLGGPSFSRLDHGSLVESLRWGADGLLYDLSRDADGDSMKPLCKTVTTRIRSMGRRLTAGV